MKSVMDTIDHHQSQIHKSKKRLKEIEAEHVSLEEQLTALDSGLVLLEQEKAILCTLVREGGDDDESPTDSASEHSAEDSEPDDARAEAFLNRLDPVKVLQWARSKVRRRRDGASTPNGTPSPHYVIGTGTPYGSDADMDDP